MKIIENTLFLDGELTKYSVPAISAELKKRKDIRISKIDLLHLQKIDSAGVAFLNQIQEQYDEIAQIINMNSDVEKTFNTFTYHQDITKINLQRTSLLEQLGNFFYRWIESLKTGIYLTADITYWSVVSLFKRKGAPKNAVIAQSLLIGVNAMGIIGLLSLILGLIIALQSAAQLRQFGANIYIADLIAISMVREMGPMMTAIILAGRSGSAIASEIATMKVTEEVDALKMMALDPIRYVVIPKFHAITLCMPLLVTMATLIGIAGGLIIAVVYLDLSAVSYFNEALQILTLKDVLVGLLKSVIFAWVIVIIASYYGFNVKGGAEGVGKVTTASVVASIFWVIVLDAVNSLVFYF